MMPISVSAALTHLPIGNVDEVLQHVLENTGWVRVKVQVYKPGEYNPLGRWYDFNRYEKADGTTESINTLARRSLTELEILILRIMREAVRVNVDRTNTTLVGQKLELSYILQQKDTLELFILGGEFNIVTLTAGGDGGIVIPEEVFNFNLRNDVATNTGIQSFFAHGILQAELTVKDGEGKVLFVKKDTDAKFDDISVFPDDDYLGLSMLYVTDPAYKRGTLKLWFRGGTEQTFNLKDGNLLKTVLPDVRPITALKLLQNSVELTVAVEDGKQVVIDYAAELPRWEELPALELLKSRAGQRTYAHPKVGKQGFYQARVVPSP